MSLKYAVFVPFTRLWAVDRFLENFEQIDIDWAQSRVIFYNDTDDVNITEKLNDWLTSRQSKIGETQLITTYNKPLAEMGNQAFVNQRRDRIVDMRKASVKYVGDTRFVFSIEDDTLPPHNSFSRLLKIIDTYPRVGLVSGVQQGRWAYPIIGAWSISPLSEPEKVSTIAFRHRGIERVDATGWYCYMTRTHLYKKADYRYEAECLGPDVCYGLDLSRMKLSCYVDWSVKCGHMIQKQGNIEVIYPTEQSKVYKWQKADNGWAASEIAMIKI